MTEDLRLLYMYLLTQHGEIKDIQINDLGEYDFLGTYVQKFNNSTSVQLMLFCLTLKPNVKDQE